MSCFYFVHYSWSCCLLAFAFVDDGKGQRSVVVGHTQGSHAVEVEV